MSLSHYQAESEIFRRGQCQQDEEEADFEEYQRRMRAAAKAKQNRRPEQPQATAPKPAVPSSVQTLLENEHESA